MKLKDQTALNRIRGFREELGLTQRALAEKIGTSQQQIQRIEAGVQSVRHDLAVKISAVLGAPVGALFPAISEAVQRITSIEPSPAHVHAPAIRRRSAFVMDRREIHNWAARLDAPAIFPQLIKRLALSSLPDLEMVQGSSEAVEHGSVWDGVFQVAQGNAFVPPGFSGWEMGTDDQIQEKADADYAARVKDPGLVQPAQSTFVFVTPRRWVEKEAWARAKRQEGLWKDVRVLDAEDVGAWLDASPAVQIWFSTLMGQRTGGVRDVESFWCTWAEATSPAITPELVMAGRSESVALVQEFLRARPSILELQADTRAEALAFFAAAVLHLGNQEERERLLARTVIVDDPTAWTQLAGWPTPLVLIPCCHDRVAVAEALAHGHSLVMSLGEGEQPSRGAIVLPRLDRDDVNGRLEHMGVPKVRAAALARKSLGAIRRALAVDAAIVTPAWAESGYARILIPALFAGQWNDHSPGDQQVVSALAGIEYGEIRALLQRWADESDPPVRLLGNMWVFASKTDGWSLLSRSMSRQDLERLESMVLEVLGDCRETVRKDSGLTPSSAIRLGLAETLAILGSWSEEHSIHDLLSGQAWATRMVTKLLSQAEDRSLWASLSPVLACLAEAAPEAFLSALERLLACRNLPLTTIFLEGTSAALHADSHTGFLDALEVLAWSPEYVARTSLILAKLAGMGSGDDLLQGPITTLREIFRCGGSGPFANLDERMRVLDLIRTDEPNVAWDLLAHIVPRSLNLSRAAVRPRWREWEAERSPTAISTEIMRAAEEIAQRQFDDAGTVGSRWKALIDRLPEVPRSISESLCGRLQSLDPGMFSDADKSVLWEALRQVASRHRREPSAPRALASDLVDRLVGLQSKYEPRDPVIKRKWLFSEEPVSSSQLSGDDYAKALQEAQISAVDTLFSQEGLPAIVALAEQVPCPEKVGTALGASQLPDASEIEILTLCLGSPNEARRQLGMHFLIKRRTMKGYNWAVRLRDQSVWHMWTPAQRADYFRCLPFPDKMTWDALDLQDEETRRLYWSQIGPHGHAKLEGQFLERVVKKFLDYRQWESVIELLGASSGAAPSRVRPGLICEVLSGVTSGSPGECDWGRLGPLVAHLFDQIVRSGEIPDTDLVRLQWKLLPFYRCDRRFGRLERALADRPDFFVEVVTCLYGSGRQDGRVVTTEQRRRAQCAHELLSQWHQGPGLNPNGSVSSETLNVWTAQVRALASRLDCLRGVDFQIGKVLAHYPSGNDGIRPHEAVRNLFEVLASDRLEEGFSLSLFNRRNVVKDIPGELCAQADRYRESSEKLRASWPRTSRVMNEIAGAYEGLVTREKHIA